MEALKDVVDSRKATAGKTALIGPSHVVRWRQYISHGMLPRMQDVPLFGVGALPLHSQHFNELMRDAEAQARRIVVMVPDFRFGNRALLMKKKFSPEKGAFSDLTVPRTVPVKLLFNEENDHKLNEICLQFLDYYVEKYKNRLRLIFWDLFTRETLNKEAGRYMETGAYRHPVWNYPEMVKRYGDYVLDISSTEPHFKSYILDDSGHPSLKGYAFLSRILRGEFPENVAASLEQQSRAWLQAVQGSQTPCHATGLRYLYYWQNYIHDGVMQPPRSGLTFSPLMRGEGLALYSSELFNEVKQAVEAGRTAYLFVPHLREGNAVLADYPEGPSGFISKHYKADKQYITPEHDAVMLSMQHRFLERYRNAFGNKLKFIFWDDFIIQHLPVHKQGYGPYAHTHDQLVASYAESLVDLRPVLDKKLPKLVSAVRPEPSLFGWYMLDGLLDGASAPAAWEQAEQAVAAMVGHYFPGAVA